MTVFVVSALVLIAVLAVFTVRGGLGRSGINHSTVETVADGWTAETSAIHDDRRSSSVLRSAATSPLARPASAQPPPDSIIDFRDRRGLIRALLSPEPPLPRRSESPMRTLAVGLLPQPLAAAKPGRGHGFTVLLDRSISMIPFAADLNELETTIATQLRRTGNRVLSFRNHPSKGVGTASDNLVPLSPEHLPKPGGVVMIVSDLGVAPNERRSEPAEWLELDHRLRRRGVTPIYLLPYDKDRLVPQLQDLNIVEWDRRLTTTMIRRRHDRWRRTGARRRATHTAVRAGSGR